MVARDEDSANLKPDIIQRGGAGTKEDGGWEKFQTLNLEP